MNVGRPISEDDLHAYVDAVLDPARRAEVEAYLAQHAKVADRVAGYVRQREALRATLAPVAAEPIPPQLNLANLIEAHRRPSRLLPWRAVAAALLMLGLGGIGGWTLRGASVSAARFGIAALAQEAAVNYAVYGTDRTHPVELKATDTAQLVNWISSRLRTPIKVPDLSVSAYRFMGGRVTATSHGPAGLLMYENGDGVRLVVFVRPMERDKNSQKMTGSVHGSVSGFTWSHDGIGYSVVGAAPPDVLHPIADEIRRQVANV